MHQGAAPQRSRVVAKGKGTFDRFDPIAATEAGDKRMGESGVVEIKRDRIVEDADQPGRCRSPGLGTAGLVEPSMNSLDLSAQPLERNGDADSHRKPPFRVLPRLD